MQTQYRQQLQVQYEQLREDFRVKAGLGPQDSVDDWIKEGIDVESFFFICARQEPILRVKFLRSVPGLQKDDTHPKNPTSPGGTT